MTICPTCSHEIKSIGYCDGGSWRLCLRCGTARHQDIISAGDPPATVYVPMLVDRCREFEAKATFYPSQWHELGIYEAIHTPTTRKDESK